MKTYFYNFYIFKTWESYAIQELLFDKKKQEIESEESSSFSVHSKTNYIFFKKNKIKNDPIELKIKESIIL